jgi:hypothetical protein
MADEMGDRHLAIESTLISMLGAAARTAVMALLFIFSL